MTFSNALNTAISGMNAATMAVQVRSHNIANAGTEGYARRDISLATRNLGGVRVVSIDYAQDAFLQARRLSADARSADHGLRADALAQLNKLFGEPGDADGLYAKISQFSTALDDLAATPESPSYQQGALTAAKELVRTFNTIGNTVIETRTNADARIASTVDEVNRALQSLDTLNKVSGEREVAGFSDIAEQRQKLIGTIADAMDITVKKASGGQIRIMTAEGVVLLGEKAQQIQFTSGGVVAPTDTLGTTLSGLSVNGIDLTPGGSGAQIVRSGSLAANFAIRDDLAPDFSNRIDAMVGDLVGRFSDLTVDPTLTPGAQGLFTDSGTGAGAANRLGINAAVDPEQGGEVWRLRDGIGAVSPGASAGMGVTQGLRGALSMQRVVSAATDSPSSFSFIDTAGVLSSVVGTKSIDAGAKAASAASAALGLRDDELAATGVNTDQELQSLLLIEQAYAANARVVQVVSDMMARLLEI